MKEVGGGGVGRSREEKAACNTTHLERKHSH